MKTAFLVRTLLLAILVFWHATLARADFTDNDFHWVNLANQRSAQLNRGLDPHDLTIFSWNIERGKENRAIEQKTGNRPLDANLTTLIKGGVQNGSHPTFITLIEYSKGFEDQPDHKDEPPALAPETTQLLETYYTPHFFQYPGTPDGVGIMVYARKDRDIRLASDTELVDWTPPGLSDAETEQFRDAWSSWNRQSTDYFSRPFIRFEINHDGKRIHYVPDHLVNPWNRLRKLHKLMGFLENSRRWILRRRNYRSLPDENDFLEEGDSSRTFPKYIRKLDNLAGILETITRIAFGKSDPLANQARNFRQKIESDLWANGYAPDEESVILGGDMNHPQEVLKVGPIRVRSAGAKILGVNGMEPVFTKAIPTWPSTTARVGGGYRELQIDWFLSRNVPISTAEVISFAGSDHIPVLLRAGALTPEGKTVVMKPTPGTGSSPLCRWIF